MSRDRRLALVSIDSRWEDPTGDFLPFSYGTSKLQASVRSCPDLADVEVRVLDLATHDPEAFFEKIVEFKPTHLGATLHLMSTAPFLELARLVKKWDPTVRIAVGGPHARPSVFRLRPYVEMNRYVDAAVTGEGEEIIRELLRNDDWDAVPGLLRPHALGWRSTGPLPPLVLNDYPTPYHLDIAPKGQTGYIESFRGCPIHCTFCQWGEESASRVFDVEHITQALLGLRRAEVPNVFVLDAAFNLNARAFRNLVAAEAATGVLAEREVHGHLYPTFLRDEHMEFIMSFGKAQVSIGIQSFDPEVLRHVGRPFNIERFERVLRAIRGHIPVELEIMLGLPGDSPEGFRRTVHRAMEIADSVRVFWTLVLPDALLDRAEPDAALDFDPVSGMLHSCKGWTNADLHREMDYVRGLAQQHHRVILADNWTGFALVRSDNPRKPMTKEQLRIVVETEEERMLPDIDIELIESTRVRVAQTVAGWTLRTIVYRRDGALFHLDSPSGEIRLVASADTPGLRSFMSLDGVGYWHEGAIPHDHANTLREVISLVHADAASLVRALPGSNRTCSSSSESTARV